MRGIDSKVKMDPLLAFQFTVKSGRKRIFCKDKLNKRNRKWSKFRLTHFLFCWVSACLTMHCWLLRTVTSGNLQRLLFSQPKEGTRRRVNRPHVINQTTMHSWYKKQPQYHSGLIYLPFHQIVFERLKMMKNMIFESKIGSRWAAHPWLIQNKLYLITLFRYLPTSYDRKMVRSKSNPARHLISWPSCRQLFGGTAIGKKYWITHILRSTAWISFKLHLIC